MDERFWARQPRIFTHYFPLLIFFAFYFLPIFFLFFAGRMLVKTSRKVQKKGGENSFLNIFKISLISYKFIYRDFFLHIFAQKAVRK